MSSARVLVLLILLTAMLGAPVPGVAAPAGSCKAQGGVLRIGNVRAPLGLDPHINYGITSSELQGNVYDSLVQYDPDGRLAPALAESWSQPSPDVYVFRLRRNVTFHDGTPFTASDVVFTFKRILDPQTKASRQKDLETGLDNVRALDAYTVQVRLHRPSATFLDMLAGREMYIVSRRWADGGRDFKQAMNGTGPFRLASYEPGVRYVLEAYRTAWSPPCLDRIEIIPIPDDRARINALRTGQVEFVDSVPWQEIEQLIMQRGFRVYRNYDIFNFVRLNPTRPPLNSSKVRQAINFAINRDAVSLLAFGGQARPMDGFLMRSDSWAFDPKTSKVWKYDPGRALALLKEAGYQSPQEVRLSFESWSGSVHFDSAQVILAQLRAFGLNVDFRVIEAAALYPKRASGDYMMLMDGLGLPWADPDAYFDFFHSSGTSYAAAVKFKNDRLDQLLEEGRQTTDRGKRKSIYEETERILFQEAPWIFAVWRPSAEAAASRVQGYVRMPGALGSYTPGYLERVWVEK
jgi:ABC-type transport system substrate-binding protein